MPDDAPTTSPRTPETIRRKGPVSRTSERYRRDADQTSRDEPRGWVSGQRAAVRRQRPEGSFIGSHLTPPRSRGQIGIRPETARSRPTRTRHLQTPPSYTQPARVTDTSSADPWSSRMSMTAPWRCCPCLSGPYSARASNRFRQTVSAVRHQGRCAELRDSTRPTNAAPIGSASFPPAPAGRLRTVTGRTRR